MGCACQHWGGRGSFISAGRITLPTCLFLCLFIVNALRWELTWDIKMFMHCIHSMCLSTCLCPKFSNFFPLSSLTSQLEHSATAQVFLYVLNFGPLSVHKIWENWHVFRSSTQLSLSCQAIHEWGYNETATIYLSLTPTYQADLSMAPTLGPLGYYLLHHWSEVTPRTAVGWTESGWRSSGGWHGDLEYLFVLAAFYVTWYILPEHYSQIGISSLEEAKIPTRDSVFLFVAMCRFSMATKKLTQS